MHISSKIGTEIFKGEYQIIDDINGIPTLETDYSKTRYNHAEPLFMMSNAYTDKFVMIIKESSSKGESSKTRYTAVHSFIYDFSLDRLYDTYTQYFSLENILGLLFSGTDYDFEVKADQTYYSLDFQNFGDDDKMNLLNKICERWELEYHITGKTVVLGQRRGQKTNKQFRYKMNITDSSVDLDISEGATYIRAAFGSKDKGTYTEREMTHPLADRFGIKHAKPYSNENITQEETMQRYMQQKIEDTWKLSIKIDISDIEGSGDVEVGDTVWAIDERLNLSYNTRIIELKRYYNKHDEVYRTEAVIGNRTFADTVSTQERSQQQEIEDKIVDHTNKMLADMQAEFDNDFNAARDEYKNQLNTAIKVVEEEVAAKDAAHKALWEETDQKIDSSIQKIIGGDISILDTNILDMSGLLSQKIEMSDLDGVTGRVNTVETELSIQEGKISSTITKQTEHSTAISTLESSSEEFSRTLGTVTSDLSTMDSDIGTLKSDISTVKQTASTLRSEVTTLNTDTKNLKDWRAEKGSLFEQTAEGFRAKVWRDDIALGVENLIPDADFVAWDSSLVPSHWKKNWGAGHTFAGRQNTKYLLVRANNETVNTSSTYGVHSPILTRDVIEGEEYTLVFNNFDFGDFPYDYMYLMNVDGSVNQNLSVPEHDRFIDKWSDANTSKNVERMVLRFTANFSGRARILWGKRIESGQQTSFYINEPMLVRGNVAPKSFAPAPADSLKQTDFVIQSDGFLLGTRKVGGDVFSAGIVGDSSGLKLLGDNISVAGNLKVKNSVNAWSVDAVSADIGKVFADSVSSSFIESKHVKFDTAFINSIITKTAFINNAEIKAANIKDLSATSISGGILKDTGSNMNWNLNTGRFAIKNSTFVYEEYGNAMVFGKGGYTGGLVFSQDTINAYPVVAIGTSLNTGTTLNPRLSLNAYTFNGISFFSGNSGENQTNLTTDNMLFRSEAGTGSKFDRGLRLTMYDLNASTDVTLEPYSRRPLVYKHYLGTGSNPFTGLYVTNLWDARVRSSGSGVTFYSKSGKYGLSLSDNGVFAIKDGKFTALHI